MNGWILLILEEKFMDPTHFITVLPQSIYIFHDWGQGYFLTQFLTQFGVTYNRVCACASVSVGEVCVGGVFDHLYGWI